jgi:hypothetical protein
MHANTKSYAHCIDASKRVRWDIEQDLIRGRTLDADRKFLPDGLSCVQDLDFMCMADKQLFSQVQGRTYANIFGLVERFICAKILDLSRDYLLDDQVALEGLIRFSDEELKHQALFRRIEQMAAEQLPAGYCFLPQANAVAQAVLSKCTWAVLALTCHIELFTQLHYKQSIAPDMALSPLYKDLFLYHWREESQHAIMDEIEWRREDSQLSEAQREQAVDDLIDLVAAVDGIVCAQAASDADYFCRNTAQSYGPAQQACIATTLVKAYRWQFIVSGVQHPHFVRVLSELTTDSQLTRIQLALAPILTAESNAQQVA